MGGPQSRSGRSGRYRGARPAARQMRQLPDAWRVTYAPGSLSLPDATALRDCRTQVPCVATAHEGSHNIYIRMDISKWMRWGGQVARMGHKTYA
jgi:hypothetical protein